MITLHQMEISPFCDKIRRVLNFKRIPHELHEVGLIEYQTRYRKLNPAGKVPTLTDGDRVICDSTDIAYYLEGRYPQHPLVPSDPQGRALNHVLEDWADESLYFYEVRLRFGIPANCARTAAKLLARENAVMKALGAMMLPVTARKQLAAQGVGRKSEAQFMSDLRRHLAAVDALLDGRDHLIGDRLMLADIAVFCMLYCIRDVAEGAAEIVKLPSIGAYMDRVDAATCSRAH